MISDFALWLKDPCIIECFLGMPNLKTWKSFFTARLLGMPTSVHSGAMSIHYNTRAGAKDLTFFAAAAHV